MMRYFRMRCEMLRATFLCLFVSIQVSSSDIFSWTRLTPARPLDINARKDYPKPVVINAWPWTKPNDAAWKILSDSTEGSAINAVVAGCTEAEEDRSIPSVGYGGSPDERGNVTLSAFVMDGDTMDVSWAQKP